MFHIYVYSIYTYTVYIYKYMRFVFQPELRTDQFLGTVYRILLGCTSCNTGYRVSKQRMLNYRPDCSYCQSFTWKFYETKVLKYNSVKFWIRLQRYNRANVYQNKNKFKTQLIFSIIACTVQKSILFYMRQRQNFVMDDVLQFFVRLRGTKFDVEVRIHMLFKRENQNRFVFELNLRINIKKTLIYCDLCGKL
eukprot:TRINITY_DN18149_c0_g2_i1.p2 TRINITY_DN18149_c0_g2~~TRINITY_DN18149_c0_g2_i1.p2  ORF type:complete len:193 (-),score=-22.47 TRINITY_DN18149_c0_g2_i1:219-797(-)